MSIPVRSLILTCLCGSLAPTVAHAQGLLHPVRGTVPADAEGTAPRPPTFWPPAPGHEAPPVPAPAEVQPAPAADQPSGPSPPPLLPPASTPVPAATVVAKSDAPAPGDRTHDRFYLRLSLGLGGVNSSAEANAVKEELSGGGLSLSVAAGWAVARNLIVFGELLRFTGDKPSRTINGFERSQSKVGNANLDGLGVGGLYYFQRLNIFVGGSLALSHFRYQGNIDGDTQETKGGLGLHAMVGKEWWVSAQWGIGAALQLMTASGKDKVMPDAVWNSGAGGVAFFATYN
jgi:hypothetical protein